MTDKEYLDKVAIKCMASIIQNKIPRTPEEIRIVARMSYRQAIAMFNVRENQLDDLYKEITESKKEEPEEVEE